MRTLQIVRTTTDGTSLVLGDRDGNEFALRIDERLSGVLRGDRPADGQLRLSEPGTFDVRQVQTAIRGGLSATEVADAYGLDEGRVARFAAPILDERRHVADQAGRALARTDAFDGRLMSVQSLLDRAEEAGELDAWRRDDGRWVAKAAVTVAGRAEVASWLLDSARRSATPLDETATLLAQVEDAPLAHDDAPAQATATPLQVVTTADGDPLAEATDTADPDEDATDTGPVPSVDVAAPTHPAEDPSPPEGPNGGRARRSRRRRTTETPGQTPLGFDGATPGRTPTQPKASTKHAARPEVPRWDDLMFGQREA